MPRIGDPQESELNTVTHTAPSVTGADSTPLAANAARRYALFVNDGAEDVFLALGAAAVADQGIRVKANGGSYAMSAKTGNLFTGAVHAIDASGATVVLLVTEGV